MKDKNSNLLMTNIGMNKDQINFIDRIVREIRFSGGKKPSRSAVINIFLKIAMVLKLNVSGVKSEKETEEIFLRIFKNHKILPRIK